MKRISITLIAIVAMGFMANAQKAETFQNFENLEKGTFGENLHGLLLRRREKDTTNQINSLQVEIKKTQPWYSTKTLK
jgi:uncharacterized protein YdbL (DUF1318 family)